MEADVQDHGTGGHSIVRPKLRLIQERFQPIKHQFDGSDEGLKGLEKPIQLPSDIGNFEDETRGFKDGALMITS